MLELLRIRDLALIEDIEMEFSPGMNVLTGETGAGKSFILKALNFLTGERLGTDLVRGGKEKAVVEALFVSGEEETILRRELAADTGRSRLFLNDRLCSQETIRDMRAALILHTSQHGQQKLLLPSFQAKILDDFMNRPDLLREKEELTRSLADCATRRTELEDNLRVLEEKRDVLEYQLQEIEKIAPKAGEEEELEAKRAAFRNQAGVTDHACAALAALHGGSGNAPNARESGRDAASHAGLMPSLAAFERHMAALARLLDDFADYPAALEEVRAALKDMDGALRKAQGQALREEDVEAVEARLYALAQLKRKLKRPLDSILALRDEVAENLNFLDSSQLERKKLALEEDELCAALSASLAKLNPARQAAAAAFSAALEDALKDLGFSEHVRVIFGFTPHALFPGREDCAELRARLLWRPNPGQPEQPLDRIASGGELSRFLLAVVTLMTRTADETPTLIFDEVDAGVGGATLTRVADSLTRLADSRQMLLITHWPQLAARAERHFVVEKEITDNQTYTRCARLAPAEITKELTRMAGG